MKKIYKRISVLLVFVVTLLTCSGCFNFKVGGGEPVNNGEVGLIGVSSRYTVKYMSESIYLGYLGAQRDFALIVDNSDWSMNTQTQKCGENGDGCASTMAKLLMYYGIKTANFTGSSGGQNLLLYYARSTEFDKFGENEWYDYLVGDTTQDKYELNDKAVEYSCGIGNSYICTYSKDLSKHGYSSRVGNAMLLLFHNGTLSSVISDKDLDPEGKLNKSGTQYDDLHITNTTAQQEMFGKYYTAIINRLKSRIYVVNASNVTNTDDTEEREITEIDLKKLKELQNSNKSYLLLITADGFIKDKVGANKYLDSNKNPQFTAYMGENNENNDDYNTFKLLFNTVSSYVDNCALEGNELLNFLKDVLESLVAGGVGALVGAGAGAAIGAGVGSIIPGVGTAIGAVVGAVVGAIVGFVSGIIIDKAIEEKLMDAQGISDKSYCKIMSSAISGLELNVPIYHYNIKSAEHNIKEGISDPLLQEYYQHNYNKCRNQNAYINVPAGVLSLFATEAMGKEYKYADVCEKEMVENIVGGFGGAPSLQLYLNGRKADDLHGRVTTELVNEMMSVWGLKQLGELYSISSKSTLKEMSTSLGSAQELKSAVWCVAESSDLTPTCDGKDTNTINLPPNKSYIGTFVPDSSSIQLDFTQTYYDFSKKHIKESVGNVNEYAFNLVNPNKDGNFTYYTKDNTTNDQWGQVEIYPHNLDTTLGTIQDAMRQNMTNYIDEGNAYQIKYNDVTYIVMDEGQQIVGYRKTASGEGKRVVYYYNGTTEYVFNDSVVIGDYSNKMDSLFFTQNTFKNEDTVIKAADDFRIYIKYVYINEYVDDDGDKQKEELTSYFQYVI